MLIDDAIHMLGSARTAKVAEQVERKLPPAARLEMRRMLNGILGVFRRCQPFVLSPLVVQTSIELADPEAISKSRPHLFTPAEITFLDCSSSRPPWADRLGARRVGVMLAGRGVRDEASITEGDMFVVADLDETTPFIGRYNLQGPGPICSWLPSSLQAAEFMDPAEIGLFVGAALALINTPRISDVRRADLSKLNKARSKRGVPPILEHKIVQIKIDKGELGQGFQKHATEERALHHVRAFLRIKRGKVELVRPHWRGNPKFGVIQHRYVAIRAEDEPGPWMGGPVPPKQIIKKLDESE